MTLVDRIAALCTGEYTADQIADIVGEGATAQQVRNVAYNRRLAIKKISQQEHLERCLAGRTKSSGWTKERTALAVRLWGDGLTASQIAAKLGDVSRNAVLGKLNRMGIDRPIGKPKIRNSTALPQAAKPKKIPNRPPALTRALQRWDVGPEPVAVDACKGIDELKERDCRWPIGDPKKAGFHFCGHRRVPGAQYCEHHLLRSVYPEYRAKIAKRYGLTPPPVTADEGADADRALEDA